MKRIGEIGAAVAVVTTLAGAAYVFNSDESEMEVMSFDAIELAKMDRNTDHPRGIGRRISIGDSSTFYGPIIFGDGINAVARDEDLGGLFVSELSCSEYHTSDNYYDNYEEIEANGVQLAVNVGSMVLDITVSNGKNDTLISKLEEVKPLFEIGESIYTDQDFTIQKHSQLLQTEGRGEKYDGNFVEIVEESTYSVDEEDALISEVRVTFLSARPDKQKQFRFSQIQTVFGDVVDPDGKDLIVNTENGFCERR